MDEYIVDDSVPSAQKHTIGNRAFRDIPEFVAIEAVPAIQLPAEIEAALPLEHEIAV